MAGRQSKGKMLEGAPPKPRATRRAADTGKGSGTRNAALVLLAVITVGTVGAIGGFAWAMWGRLDHGLLAQREAARHRPDWVRLDELPRHVPDAFTAVVDTASFRRVPPEERGRNPMLSRDLVRQVHRLANGGVGGDARELVMSPLLENALSKRGLFELYLNRISMGRTGDWPVYGVFHASREYFGKDPRKLSLAEAATLAGILLPPALPSPEQSPGPVGARRNEVLRRMLEAGRITPAAYRQAAREPLAFQPGADYAPMARPVDWKREPEVIRLPPELRPSLQPDSAQGPAPE
ncbi:MAG TPA: transglycosylase domain-containing protein [Longimicrobium sp.]